MAFLAPIAAFAAAHAAAIGVAGSLASLAGTGVAAFSSIEQGQYAEKAAEYNAEMANQQAQEASTQSKYRAFDLSQQRRQMIGRQIAGYGGAGVNPNSGSPLDVMANTAAEYENDIYMAGLSADQATSAGTDQATLDQMSGRQAAMAGWMGAGSSMLSGFGKTMLMTTRLGG